MGARSRRRRKLYIPGQSEAEHVTHHPGPLEWVECGDARNVEFQIRARGSTGNEVDELLAFTNEGDPADRALIVANAALFAFAPELKAMLSAFVNCDGIKAIHGYEDEVDSMLGKAKELLWMLDAAPYNDMARRAG